MAPFDEAELRTYAKEGGELAIFNILFSGRVSRSHLF